MKKLQKVVWSKGMFLTPQHFQTQEEYLEDSLHFRFAASNFANWGVITLGIDEESLANGVFRLRYCRGILPDGLLFHMPEADELPPSRNVEEVFPPTQPTLDVYLSIPEHRVNARSFTIAANAQAAQIAGSMTRFVAQTEMVPDANAGSDEKPVQIGRKALRLLFEGENRDGYTSLRIAQLSRNTEGVYILSPRFIPPCLDIHNSEYLMGLLRRQIEVMKAKASTLAQPRREKNKNLADFTTSEVSSYWLLHTINSYTPELQHIWAVRRGHPEPAFVAMLRLAGALSTFALEEDKSTELPQYDHDNLGYSFSELDARIRDLLETVFPSKCVPVPLVLSNKLTWSGNIPDDQYFHNTQFYLSISARMGVDELINSVPRLARVSSPADIQRLVHNALPGVPLRHVPVPPPAIPRRIENQYFLLDQGARLWEGVTRSRNVSVFVPGEIADPRMELLIALE
jgi:type VI secretion system protein ImpJ